MKSFSGLHVHLDTHPERLFAKLAEALAAEARRLPLGTPQIVAVGAKGMGRWIEQELAHRHGLAAGIDFPFPAKLVQRILDLAAPRDTPSRMAVTREALRWRISVLLQEILAGGAAGDIWQPLRAYVCRSPSAIDHGRLFEVAAEAARALDAAEVHRPLQLNDDAFWATRASSHAPWLQDLRRRLSDLDSHGFAARRRLLVDGVGPIEVDQSWPPALHVFGLSTVPCAYIEIFRAFGRRTGRAVHLYRSVPSLHWLGEHSRRAWAADAHDLHPYVVVNGQAARRMQHMLLELDTAGAFAESTGPLEPEDPPSTALEHFQSSLRSLEPLRIKTEPVDHSLRFLVAPNPLREMEALRDELLQAFAALPGLQPRDVLVLLPDVESWVPWIRAAFGPVEHLLPFSIADRPARDALPGVEAFFAAIDVLGGRLDASTVHGLLAREPIRRAFGLAADDLSVLRGWIEESGARWGWDAADRARALGMEPGEIGAPDDAFTWRFALDRMVLGWFHGSAAPPDLVGEWQGPRAPFEPVTGPDATFAPTARAFAFLGELRASWSRLRPIADVEGESTWAAALAPLFELLLPAVEYEDAAALRELAGTVDRLQDTAGRYGFCDPVALAAFQRLLVDAWGEASPHSQFLGGGLTFASLTPLRGVPFRVVALAGFADGAWPRPVLGGEFDLLRAAGHAPASAGVYEAGDPDRRQEDRLAFLEAILAARERLIVSWVGRDPRTGAELPPALVVGELLDELQAQFGEGLRSMLVDHPLHAFAARVERRLEPPLGAPAPVRSESARRAHDALGAATSYRLFQSFWDGRVDVAAVDKGPLTIKEFAAFSRGPAKAWLHRHGIRRLYADPELPTEDPTVLGTVEQRDLVERLLALPDLAPERVLRRLRGEGRLPAGPTGDLAFGDAVQVADAFRRLLPAGWGCPDADFEDLHIDLELPVDALAVAAMKLAGSAAGEILSSVSGVRIQGRVRHWRAADDTVWTVSTDPADRGRTRWDAWWPAALVAAQIGRPVSSVVVAVDKKEQPVRLTLSEGPVSPARHLLAAAALLLARRGPLSWDADMAAAWADVMYQSGDADKAEQAARKASGLDNEDRLSATAASLRMVWGGGLAADDDAGLVWESFRDSVSPLPSALRLFEHLSPPALTEYLGD